jgi:hypothetical protein
MRNLYRVTCYHGHAEILRGNEIVARCDFPVKYPAGVPEEYVFGDEENLKVIDRLLEIVQAANSTAKRVS